MAAVSPTMLAVLTIGVGALVLGILIGMYTMPVTLTPELKKQMTIVHRLTKQYYRLNDSDPVYRALIDGPQIDSIRANLRYLSSAPHQAGSARDEEMAQEYKRNFEKYGLDRAYVVPYKVLLSYANPQRPNKVYIIDKQSNEPLLITSHKETQLFVNEVENNVPAYNGYAPEGDISGEPVYCNYGREEDFELLREDARIDLDGKICIIRYGKIYRGNKVNNAARYGCAAVIFYSDPELVAPFDTRPEAVYPNSIWMNGQAMQRGNIGTVSGDPLTQGFASIDGGFRYDATNKHTKLPSIPSQPIGYDYAKEILEQMGGISTKQNIKFLNWTGALDITYRLGPGFMDQDKKQLRIVINNELVQKTIYNVIGVLDGHLEPDRFVIVGNHRDAWGFGALDASSGGAAMLETAKVIGNYHKETGWRPRRSLVFASWSGEEFGLIGSTEWVEELRPLLASDVVAYLNVDTCVSGPLLRPDASPSLMEVLRAATKRVPAHKTPFDKESPSQSNQTLYQSWLNSIEQKNNNDKIRVQKLSSGSDQVPFTFFAGVPSINIEFKHDKRKYPVSSYPAYHTGYETYYLMENFIDPHWFTHQTCSRLISILLYALSCSTLIPVQLTELSDRILDDYRKEGLAEQLRKQLPADQSNSIELLEKSMKNFANQTLKWQQYLSKVNNTPELLDDPYLVRRINDIMMRVERAFTDTAGRSLHKRADTRNLLFGPPQKDFYSIRFFPGLHDLLDEIRHKEIVKARTKMSHAELQQMQTDIEEHQTELWRHLNDITISFQFATRLLQEKSI